tara:strand:+ start:737 stop:1450 length:714 start_codon:yes stop_codon:yes gene_type:complete
MRKMRKMRKINKFRKYGMIPVLAVAVLLTGCEKEEDEIPEEEHDHEVITDVKLVFTNTLDSTDVVEALAQDPDGEGIEDLTIVDSINLKNSTAYTLTFEILNRHEDEHDDHEGEEHDDDHDDHEGEEHDDDHAEDIGAEIEEEADEHQFFFAFSNDAFANPTGDGNIDNASDAINYNDSDENGNPLGMNTSWETSSSTLSNGSFTVRLQHQPGVKTASSGANDGDSDFDLTFVLNVE